jgi:cytochrome c553
MHKMLLSIAALLSSVGMTTGCLAANMAAGHARAAQCAACHGVDGHATAPDAPNLAGQNEDYLVQQLQDFRSGARKNETMSVVAKPLSDTEIANLAAYYHSLK